MYQSTRHTLAIDAQALAAHLGVSVRHVRRMDAAGQIPRPLRFGRAVRWSRVEIEEWMFAGSPDRETWEALMRDRN